MVLAHSDHAGIRPDSEGGEAGEGRGADFRVVLPDPAGEGDRVHPPEEGGVGPRLGLQSAGEDRAGEAGVLRSGVGRLLQFPHVAGEAGEAGEARVAGEKVLQFVRGATFAKQVEEHARVEVAGPGGHGQSTIRGEAHRGGDGPALAQGGEGTTAPEVGEEGPLSEVLAELVDHIGVGEAVEAIAPHSLSPAFHRQGEDPLLFGKVGEEGGVETGGLGQVGEHRAARLDAGDPGRLVEGSQWLEGFQFGEQVRIDPGRLPAVSPMDNAVGEGFGSGQVLVELAEESR